jgi:hypothetical protein
MTLEGIDFSHGPVPAATARANGIAFECRYVSTPGNPKNLTAAEVDDLTAGNVDIVVVFETTAQGALGGNAKGVTDAASADRQVSTLGLEGCPIYFAADFDVRAAQLPTIGDYLAGVASVIGLDRVGVYGNYAVVQYALDNGLATYAWQTKAWSHGKIEPRAHLYQYQNDQLVGDVRVDRSRTVASDTAYGQAVSMLPLITGVDPAEGPEEGQTTVVVTGSRLSGATDVGFGVTGATTVSVDSDTQITTVSPPGTGTVDITVTTPAGTSATTEADTFTYVPADPLPEVDRIDPATGPEDGQTTVELTGSRFTGATVVSFGPGNDAPVDQSVADDRITIVSPAGTGTVDVTVTTPAGTSAPSDAARFTYMPAPQVTGLDPASGPEDGQTTVVVGGSGFTGTIEVDFGATPADEMTVDSDSQITVTSPAGTGSVDVTVSTPAGTSAATPADVFTYVADE